MADQPNALSISLGEQGFPQIHWKVMGDASGYLTFAHGLSPLGK
jgi:hypothetical protein